jgi:FkbM family methyltransferase
MLIPFDKIVLKYGKPKRILHVGASTGQEWEAYKNNGVAHVTWIEAIPSVFDQLWGNIKDRKQNGFFETAINACISDVDGEKVIFNITNNEGQSSSFLELGTHKIQHPEVSVISKMEMDTITIGTLWKTGKISSALDYDFVNLDIQGAELKAIKGMGEMLNQFKFVYSEVNRKHVYKDCALLPEMDAYLKGFGFRRVALAPWIGDWSDALWIKR